MRKKLVIPSIIVALLVVGGIFWYLKQNTPVLNTATDTLDISALEKELGIEIKEIEPPTSDIDTSNWKTYRNEEYGFEFKYPPYYSDFPLTGEGFAKQFVAGGIGGVTEAVGIFTTDRTLDEQLRFMLNLEDSRVDSIEYFVSKSGLKVVRLHDTATGGVYSGFSYFFTKGGNTFSFGGDDGTPEDEKVQAAFSSLVFFSPKINP